MHRTNLLEHIVKSPGKVTVFSVSVKLQTGTEAATHLSEIHARCWLGEQPPSQAVRGNTVSQGPQLGQLQIWPSEVKICWNFTLQEDRLVELKNSAAVLFMQTASRSQPQNATTVNPACPQDEHPGQMNIQERRTSRTEGKKSLVLKLCRYIMWFWSYTYIYRYIHIHICNFRTSESCCISTSETDLRLVRKDVHVPRRNMGLTDRYVAATGAEISEHLAQETSACHPILHTRKLSRQRKVNCLRLFSKLMA